MSVFPANGDGEHAVYHNVSIATNGGCKVRVYGGGETVVVEVTLSKRPGAHVHCLRARATGRLAMASTNRVPLSQQHAGQLPQVHVHKGKVKGKRWPQLYLHHAPGGEDPQQRVEVWRLGYHCRIQRISERFGG